jgi:hypothetical protein
MVRASANKNSIVRAGGNPLFPIRESIANLLRTAPASAVFAVYKRKSARPNAEGKHDAYDVAQERMVEHLQNCGVPHSRIQVFDDVFVSGTTELDERPQMVRLVRLIMSDNVALVAGLEAARYFRDRESVNVYQFTDQCRDHNVPIVTNCNDKPAGFAWLDMRSKSSEQRFVRACFNAGTESVTMTERSIESKITKVKGNKYVGGKTPVGFYCDTEGTIRVYKPHVPLIIKAQEIALDLATNHRKLASYAHLTFLVRQAGIRFPPFTAEGLETDIVDAVKHAYDRSINCMIKTDNYLDGVETYGPVTVDAAFYLSADMMRSLLSCVMLLGVRLFGSGPSAYSEVKRRFDAAETRGEEFSTFLRDTKDYIRTIPELSIYKPGEDRLFFDVARFYSKIDLRRWADVGFSSDTEEDLEPGENSVADIPWERSKYRDNRDYILTVGRSASNVVRHAKFGSLGFCMRHGLSQEPEFFGSPNREYAFSFVSQARPQYDCSADYDRYKGTPICSTWGNDRAITRMLTLESNDLMRGIIRNSIPMFTAAAAQWTLDEKRKRELEALLDREEAAIIPLDTGVSSAQANQTAAINNLATLTKYPNRPTEAEVDLKQSDLRAATFRLENAYDERAKEQAKYHAMREELSAIDERLTGLTPNQRQANAESLFASVMEDGDMAPMSDQQAAMHTIIDWFGVLAGRKDQHCFESLIGVRWTMTPEMTWYVGWRLWSDDLRPFTDAEKAHLQKTWAWGQWETDILPGLLPNRRFSEVEEIAVKLPGTNRKATGMQALRESRGTHLDRETGKPYILNTDARKKSLPFDHQYPAIDDARGVSHLRLVGHPSTATRCYVIGTDGKTIAMAVRGLNKKDGTIPIPAQVRAGLAVLLKDYTFAY